MKYLSPFIELTICAIHSCTCINFQGKLVTNITIEKRTQTNGETAFMEWLLRVVTWRPCDIFLSRQSDIQIVHIGISEGNREQKLQVLLSFLDPLILVIFFGILNESYQPSEPQMWARHHMFSNNFMIKKIILQYVRAWWWKPNLRNNRIVIFF